jgi:type IV pilus assembly protein PilA
MFKRIEKNNGKSFIYSSRRSFQSGFTLVELMIVIAIIGVLSAVAVPNFKKFQARTKTTEAKIQLASVYAAQTSFYQLFDMYATCLDYMGFNPAREQSKRYYAIGFPNFSANVDAGFYNSAVGERLVSSACPRDLADTVGSSVYLAGKSVGSAVIDNLAEFRSATPIASNNLDDGVGPYSSEVHSGLGIQLTEENKVFTAAAAGYIESTKVTPTESSLWTINQVKKLTNFRPGY